jgi:endonuclease YncB( thermonuclease family)
MRGSPPDVPVSGDILNTYKDKKEKYGRWLGTVFLPTPAGDLNLNADMVSSGHAVPFMTAAFPRPPMLLLPGEANAARTADKVVPEPQAA